MSNTQHDQPEPLTPAEREKLPAGQVGSPVSNSETIASSGTARDGGVQLKREADDDDEPEKESSEDEDEDEEEEPDDANARNRVTEAMGTLTAAQEAELASMTCSTDWMTLEDKSGCSEAMLAIMNNMNILAAQTKLLTRLMMVAEWKKLGKTPAKQKDEPASQVEEDTSAKSGHDGSV